MAAAQGTTVIGPGSVVRGRVTGTGDLEIAGRIEGDVSCTGDVTVESSGLVGASISARRIVVRGAVKGDLVAEDAVLIEAGARVVGDLRAPRIAVAPGGLVRGHVQTGGAGAARPRSAQTSASRAASTSTSARVTPKAAAPAAKAAPPRMEARMEARVEARVEAKKHAGAARRVGPPAPVVPVLKKGTKATQKKR